METTNQSALAETSQGRQGLGIFLIQAQYLDKIKAEADYIFKFKKGDKLEAKTVGFDLPENLRDMVFEEDTLLVAHHNAYVNTGLNNSLDREWGLGGTAIGFIGMDNDSTAVTATTTFLHGSSTAAVGNNTVASGATAGGNTVTLTSAAGVQAGMGFGFQAGGATAEVLVVQSVASNVVTFTTNLQFTHSNGTRVDWVGASIKTISPAATRTNQTTTGGATFANADFAAGTPTVQNLIPVLKKIGLLNTSTDAGTGLIDVIGGSGGSSPYNRSFSLDLTAAGTFSVVAQIAVTAVAI